MSDIIAKILTDSSARDAADVENLAGDLAATYFPWQQ